MRGVNVASGLYSAINQLKTAGLAEPWLQHHSDHRWRNGRGFDPHTRGLTERIQRRRRCCQFARCCAATRTCGRSRRTRQPAQTLGINISTVSYSGDTTGTTNQTAYAAALKTLVSGTGIALVAPTAAQIDASFGSFCASMGSAVKMGRGKRLGDTALSWLVRGGPNADQSPLVILNSRVSPNARTSRRPPGFRPARALRVAPAPARRSPRRSGGMAPKCIPILRRAPRSR